MANSYMTLSEGMPGGQYFLSIDEIRRRAAAREAMLRPRYAQPAAAPISSKAGTVLGPTSLDVAIRRAPAPAPGAVGLGPVIESGKAITPQPAPTAVIKVADADAVNKVAKANGTGWLLPALVVAGAAVGFGDEKPGTLTPTGQERLAQAIIVGAVAGSGVGTELQRLKGLDPEVREIAIAEVVYEMQVRLAPRIESEITDKTGSTAMALGIDVKARIGEEVQRKASGPDITKIAAYAGLTAAIGRMLGLW